MKADVVVAVARLVPAEAGGTVAPRTAVPTTTTVDSAPARARANRIRNTAGRVIAIPIRTPFPDVTVLSYKPHPFGA